MDVDAIIAKFAESTRARLRSTTQAEYAAGFRRFAQLCGLSGMTRRQFQSRGRDLVVGFLKEKLPRKTWNWKIQLSRLKVVWTSGTGLPWPVDERRDVGRIPRPNRGRSPPDETVKSWAAAVRNERDVYLRLVWLLLAQLGLRPQHVAALTWRDLEWAGSRPVALVASASGERFKTDSPVAARLPDDLADAIVEWRAQHPEPLPENPIVPWRSTTGSVKVRPRKRQSEERIRGLMDELATKWALTRLRPKDLRHWVASQCRKAGLSKQASAYLMGHDPTHGGAMRDWYDNVPLDDIFAEQQEKLRQGPLGLLEPPKVEIVGDLPRDAVIVLREFFRGRVGVFEVAQRLEAMRAKADVSRPEIAGG